MLKNGKSAGPCLSGASGCENRELPAVTCHQSSADQSAVAGLLFCCLSGL
jgi:hypothetical protein